MTGRILSALVAVAVVFAAETPTPPQAGKVEILKLADVRPGMKGTAWTVFEGMTPEPIPVDIVGVWRNTNGPGQDMILAKLGGKALRTNVAGGMSGSPVYINGKLVGAIGFRISVFSPDAVCGITPIESMLEINAFDPSRPDNAKTPQNPRPVSADARTLNNGMTVVPIETPLAFAGFHENVMQEYGPLFRQLGLTPVQGGAAGALRGAKPVAGWERALRPGQAVSAVLVSGDMSITGTGTVTYNDGKRLLAFGHPFFNLGPVEMPMAQSEVLMVLSSQYQPNKFANATEIVGAFRQDRHAGIMGELGQEAKMIPVTVKVRTLGERDVVRREKDFHFSVFVNQKWTPNLMMFTLYNTLSGINDLTDDATYRLAGQVELEGRQKLTLRTMQAPGGDMAGAPPVALAGWWGDKFNRLFQNYVDAPKLRSVSVSVDILPDRRTAAIENSWAEKTEVAPGEEIPVKVFLRPFRGERVERGFKVRVPEGLPQGEYRILLSDADTLNRLQTAAGMVSRYMDVTQTVSLINQERSNNRLYVSLLQGRPTLYTDDKSLPSLPASVLNVMQSGRQAGRPFLTAAETAQEQMSLPFDFVVSGAYALRITVK